MQYELHYDLQTFWFSWGSVLLIRCCWVFSLHCAGSFEKVAGTSHLNYVFIPKFRINNAKIQIFSTNQRTLHKSLHLKNNCMWDTLGNNEPHSIRNAPPLCGLLLLYDFKPPLLPLCFSNSHKYYNFDKELYTSSNTQPHQAKLFAWLFTCPQSELNPSTHQQTPL